MTPDRLDTIARRLAAASSRRTLLRLLGGSALAGAGLAGMTAGTEAKSGQACCAERRKGCQQLCRAQGRKLDNADFTCNPQTCTPHSVILCNCR